MATQALLVWLVTYVSFLAFFGFLLYVVREFGDRGWSNRALLRSASLLAFVGATAFWFLLLLVD